MELIRITSAENKFVKITTKYTWQGFKPNNEFFSELKVCSVWGILTIIKKTSGCNMFWEWEDIDYKHHKKIDAEIDLSELNSNETGMDH